MDTSASLLESLRDASDETATSGKTRLRIRVQQTDFTGRVSGNTRTCNQSVLSRKNAARTQTN